MDKLYGVVRNDLRPGLMAAQVGHALIGWALKYGAPPENLVILETTKEHLEELRQGFADRRSVAFYEPDVNDELTAIAVSEPDAHRALSALPLALKEAPQTA